MIPAESDRAVAAFDLVKALQSRFVRALEAWGEQPFTESGWLRDDGRHGGGVRYGTRESGCFNQASVNVSQVHYDDEPHRKLGSASALSTIVHPASPAAPSVHIHISWTEMKNGEGYWRMMTDLNPSIPDESDRKRFIDALRAAAPDRFQEACAQGDRYFYIPALERHRGVAHFYLEGFNNGDFQADLALAGAVGETSIDTYMDILSNRPGDASPTSEEAAAQLNYHTLYFFQVLTLDRGTTTGLLVHDQNDIGILGSLPARVDRNLLSSWKSRMPVPQDKLLECILEALPDEQICAIDDDVKLKLAAALRSHYARFPEALDLQAGGNLKPPTFRNHR